MESSGLHSNGYSLVRHVLLAKARLGLDRDVPELGRTLGEELLEPTRIYAKACLDAGRPRPGTHAMAHVTGGGLAANLARVMPEELRATLDRGTWTPQPIFDLVRRVGDVPQPDLEATLNCGVGMVALTRRPSDVDAAIALLAGTGSAPGWPARWRPTPSAAAASSWSASTPVGDDLATGRYIGLESGISGTGVREQPASR